MQAKTLKDMRVVNMGDGALIGTVDQIFFDAENLRVATLLIVADEGESTLPFAAVRSVGPDAVTVEDAPTQGADVTPDLLELDNLVGLPVLTGEGAEVGEVSDVMIDPGNGQITELAVHRGGKFGIGGTSISVAGSAIRGIGSTVVTVEAPAARDTPPAP